MRAKPAPAPPAPAPRVAPHTEVAALISDMAADQDGDFSASPYETGRVLAFAPSLSGHAERLQFLLDSQHADGSWGGPAEYALLPTLSVLAGLLHEASRSTLDGPLEIAITRGLDASTARLHAEDAPALPDTVAIEVLVPGLIADINAMLGEFPALANTWGPLPVPPGTRGEMLDGLRELIRLGRPLPHKLLHSVEMLGSDAHRLAGVVPDHGTIGCSPAATAVWLGDAAIRAGAHECVDYLRRVVQPSTGAVPVAAPVNIFERAWVVATLADTGIEFTVPPGFTEELRAALSTDGAAGGHGLPPDGDDTAAVLYALAKLGEPAEPDSLWQYFRDDHFDTFPAERTPSITTNAHALQALGAHRDGAAAGQVDHALDSVTRWLADQQESDGRWWDKWHASPFYATACASIALAQHGTETGREALTRARRWVLGQQRSDGSWGRWDSTREETAYALKTLLLTGDDEESAASCARGCAHLLATAGDTDLPPLWHDKDLYTPTRIVRTEILAALHLGQRTPAVARRVPAWSSLAEHV